MMTKEKQYTKFLLNLDITLKASSEQEVRKWVELLSRRQTVADCVIREVRKLEQPETSQATPTKTEAASSLQQLFQGFIDKQKLVRLTIVKGKGVKYEIPCRILNVDMPNERVNVYHVDEKQVYTFRFAEIEDYKVYLD